MSKAVLRRSVASAQSKAGRPLQCRECGATPDGAAGSGKPRGEGLHVLAVSPGLRPARADRPACDGLTGSEAGPEAGQGRGTVAEPGHQFPGIHRASWRRRLNGTGCRTATAPSVELIVKLPRALVA
jgi:hypothetical protein